MKRACPASPRQRQSGAALLVLLTLLALWGLYLFVGQLSAGQLVVARAQEAAVALAEARQALIGDAISQTAVGDAGSLRLPDIGEKPGPVPNEGDAALVFAGNDKDLSVLGKFPWQTLRTAALRDASGECLWYVVSGRFKKAPATDALNWDTQGQLDLIDGAGNSIATNLAALIVAPGRALDTQDRTRGDEAYVECGGNYEARNYLDPSVNEYAIAGRLNYFAGGTNGRVAPNAGNSTFVVADNAHYNDRLARITVDDLFTPIMRRSDFALAIGALLDHPAFRTIAIAGNKGTDNLVCSAAPSKSFCDNWREMFLLTQFAAPTSVTIDGVQSPPCNRVLIFGGRRTPTQGRSSPADKANPNNYLEGGNAVSFGVPMATASNFSGASVFDWSSPTTDLVRCLP